MKYGLKCLMIACLSSLLVLGACSDDEKKSNNNANNTNNSTLNNDNNTNNDDQDVSEGEEDVEEPGDEDVEEPGDEDVEEPGDEDVEEPGDEDVEEPGDEWQQPTEPVESCGDLGLTDLPDDFEEADGSCYSNAECGADASYRCETIGDPETSLVQCCVPLPRGETAVGESCTTATDCESGLCRDDYCSTYCEQDEDCPETLSQCARHNGVCQAGE